MYVTIAIFHYFTSAFCYCTNYYITVSICFFFAVIKILMIKNKGWNYYIDRNNNDLDILWR